MNLSELLIDFRSDDLAEFWTICTEDGHRETFGVICQYYSRRKLAPPTDLEFSISLRFRWEYSNPMQDPPRPLSLLLDDNIHFEDALGRKTSLPFTYFQYYNVGLLSAFIFCCLQ